MTYEYTAPYGSLSASVCVCLCVWKMTYKAQVSYVCVLTQPFCVFVRICVYLCMWKMTTEDKVHGGEDA